MRTTSCPGTAAPSAGSRCAARPCLVVLLQGTRGRAVRRGGLVRHRRRRPCRSPFGYMQITDRAKDVIKSGGEWISSIEIENLAVGHPDVAEAAVIGVAHPKWDERPLLVIVVKEGRSPSKTSFSDFLTARLPNGGCRTMWCSSTKSRTRRPARSRRRRCAISSRITVCRLLTAEPVAANAESPGCLSYPGPFLFRSWRDAQRSRAPVAASNRKARCGIKPVWKHFAFFCGPVVTQSRWSAAARSPTVNRRRTTHQDARSHQSASTP
jgi:hypothetical protein